jgi:hypothetical protein
VRALAGFLVAATLVTLTASCGTAVSPTRVTSRSSASVPARARQHPPWPPGGSRALARTVARRLLARLVLPAGAHPAGRRGAPPRAEVIGSMSLLDLHRFVALPMPLSAAVAYFRGHPPAGMEASGTGTTSDRGRVTEQDVSFSLRRPRVGITSETELLVSLAMSRSGGTAMRADAEVIWYPPRSAAEYLRAGSIRSARISASFLNPRPRHFGKVATSGRVIARIAALLDGMRATDNSVMYCPMIDASYQVTFTARAGRHRVVVDATGCARDIVSVNGKDQPPLFDPGNALIKALHRVLALSPRYR